MKRIQTLSALFSFSRFRARSRLQRIFGDPHARLPRLLDRQSPPIQIPWAIGCNVMGDQQTGHARVGGWSRCGMH